MEKRQYRVVTLAGESVFGFHNYIFHNDESNTIEIVTVYPEFTKEGTVMTRKFIGIINNCHNDISKFITRF